MFAALGPVSFQVLGSPKKYKTTQKFHYAKLEVIGAAPILQWIYDDLQTIKLEIYLHSMWCNPQTAFAALQQLAETHQAQNFVLGNGLLVGSYVLSELQDEEQWMADDGSRIALTATIELTQWVSSEAALTPSQLGAPVNPPGLSTSQTSSPGSAILLAPATASPSGIPPQTPFTAISAHEIARGY